MDTGYRWHLVPLHCNQDSKYNSLPHPISSLLLYLLYFFDFHSANIVCNNTCDRLRDYYNLVKFFGIYVHNIFIFLKVDTCDKPNQIQQKKFLFHNIDTYDDFDVDFDISKEQFTNFYYLIRQIYKYSHICHKFFTLSILLCLWFSSESSPSISAGCKTVAWMLK